MIRQQCIAIAMVGSLVLLGCQGTVSELSDEDVAAIRAASATYVETALAQDWERWASVSEDDAIIMPPNQAPIETREARIAWTEGFPPMPSLTVTPAEIVGRGDLAYVRGTWSFTLEPEGASPIMDGGHYIEIWRKGANGVWRISRDIWNSDRPLSPQ